MGHLEFISCDQVYVLNAIKYSKKCICVRNYVFCHLLYIKVLFPLIKSVKIVKVVLSICGRHDYTCPEPIVGQMSGQSVGFSHYCFC